MAYLRLFLGVVFLVTLTLTTQETLMPQKKNQGAAYRAAQAEADAKARGELSFEQLIAQQKMGERKRPKINLAHASTKPKEPTSPVARQGAMVRNTTRRTDEQALATEYLESIRDQWPGSRPSAAQMERALAYAQQQSTPSS